MGPLSAGMTCSHTIRQDLGNTRLTQDEMLDFLDSGAVCHSGADELKLKTALEQACRLLGKRCTYELKKQIESMGSLSKKR